jgi:hypothetical protein
VGRTAVRVAELKDRGAEFIPLRSAKQHRAIDLLQDVDHAARIDVKQILLGRSLRARVRHPVPTSRRPVRLLARGAGGRPDGRPPHLLREQFWLPRSPGAAASDVRVRPSSPRPLGRTLVGRR